MTPKLPPQNLDAERGLIGSILLWPDNLHAVAIEVSPADFYLEAYGLLFGKAVELQSRGCDVTPESIATELLPEWNKRFPKQDIVETITECYESVPHGATGVHYARLVRQLAIRRGVIRAASEMTREAFDETIDVDSLLVSAERSLEGVAQHRAGVAAHSLREVAIELLAEMGAPQLMPRSTGFVDLDKQLAGGFRPGQLIVLGARPGMGKTAFAGSVAVRMARAGHGVLFFSMEQSRAELMVRFVSADCSMSAEEILSGRLEEYQQWALTQSINKIGALPIWIDDRAGRTMTQMAALARLHVMRDKVGLIVVDYLQLIAPEDRSVPREVQVATISRQLKTLAKQCEVPVLALAQLNRGVEGRAEKTPMLTDLRESGSIEQDADIAMFLVRESVYDREAPDDQATITVAKHRNGQTGSVRLKWDGRHTAFGDWTLHDPQGM